jgi:hypothetical protein
MNRLQTIFRGGTASLIYHHSLSTKDNDSELGALTLMSNDIDIVNDNMSMALEVWAYFVEVVIGIWLLWRQLGPVALAPVAIVLMCSYLQIPIGGILGARRAVWTAAIQKRVGITSNLLRSMKSIKLSGMVKISADLVQAERVNEVDIGKKFRWMIVWMNAIGKPSQIGYSHPLVQR